MRRRSIRARIEEAGAQRAADAAAALLRRMAAAAVAGRRSARAASIRTSARRMPLDHKIALLRTHVRAARLEPKYALTLRARRAFPGDMRRSHPS